MNHTASRSLTDNEKIYREQIIKNTNKGMTFLLPIVFPIVLLFLFAFIFFIREGETGGAIILSLGVLFFVWLFLFIKKMGKSICKLPDDEVYKDDGEISIQTQYVTRIGYVTDIYFNSLLIQFPSHWEDLIIDGNRYTIEFFFIKNQAYALSIKGLKSIDKEIEWGLQCVQYNNLHMYLVGLSILPIAILPAFFAFNIKLTSEMLNGILWSFGILLGLAFLTMVFFNKKENPTIAGFDEKYKELYPDSD